MDDIAKIAAGLSEAQRRLLIGDFSNGPLRNRSYGQIRGALIRKGIFEKPIGLTALGQQVRTYLENSK